MTNQFRRHDRPRPGPQRADRNSTVVPDGSAYELAHRDLSFLERDELRSVRFQLEVLKPDLLLDEAKIESTFVIFGSARTPGFATSAKTGRTWYEDARELARLASSVLPDPDGARHFVVCSGGGPAIMEAANRGAADVGQSSIGLSVVLPFEAAANKFVTPELSFQFHYFALRKMHFVLRARAMTVFPGGFGTLDELFDVLTLMQTGKMPLIPLVLFDKAFWKQAVDFDHLVTTGMIDPRDLGLFKFAGTAEEAWEIVQTFYRQHPEPLWHRAGLHSVEPQ